jgi:hypothetical protein
MARDFSPDKLVAHQVGEKVRRRSGVAHTQFSGVHTAQGVLGRNAGAGPAVPTVVCHHDDFDGNAIRIGEGQHLFPEARAALGGHVVAVQPFVPVIERRFGCRQRDRCGLASTDLTVTGAGPIEERDDTARGAGLVSVIEMVGGRVVEVDGLLDEAQAEQAGVEIDVRLGIGGDGRKVVEPGDVVFHVIKGFSSEWE